MIVEAFIDFDYEITLLTLTQTDGPTLFCPPIGHRQERGDYQESWQPAIMEPDLLHQAQEMAREVTDSLGGASIWGVEFFVEAGKEGQPGKVYFSELSPRPHDTGMVTLAGTQNFNEFELHARAILGLPVAEIEHHRNGASAVILAAPELKEGVPILLGVAEAAAVPGTDLRLFGKPTVRPYRRMGVAVAYGDRSASVETLTAKAKQTAALVEVRQG